MELTESLRPREDPCLISTMYDPEMTLDMEPFRVRSTLAKTRDVARKRRARVDAKSFIV